MYIALFIINPQLQILAPFSIYCSISSGCVQLLVDVLVGVQETAGRCSVLLCSSPSVDGERGS